MFMREKKELSVTQISKELGIHKSTVCRTLETMENRGFVRQNPETGKYWLGLQLYSLGMLFREHEPLKKVVHPYAQALAERFNEGVHLTMLHKNGGPYPQHIVLDKIQSQQVLNLAPPVGSVSPSYCSASGKVLMAYEESDYVKQYIGCPLPRFTQYTVTDWDTLLQELEQIRRQGYALDREELEIGLTCIAAPILAEGHIVAAISLSGPVSRISEQALPEIIAAVQQSAKDISALL
jgi:DNA-binding IclR family transcriptional regulator